MPMPRVALDRVRAALEWKTFPQGFSDRMEINLPKRVRTLLANLIGATPEAIALTTGASAGLIALALGLPWKPGDEVLTASREFPVQYTTWRPMEARAGIRLKLVSPRGQWIAAEDLIAALTPQTRLVSVSLVRFEDGSMLDAGKLAAACHAQQTLLALDVSQGCGGIPMDVRQLGADFLTCSGYKWLMGPYGSGFFWGSEELMRRLLPSPFYWQGIAGLTDYDALIFENPKPAEGVRGWDAPETASYFNLAGWEASLELLTEIGVPTVAAHNRKLMTQLFGGLPKDRCVWTSPLEPERQGPYGCFAASELRKTQELYQKLRDTKLFASLREGNIRVSTHLYNTEEDIEKLVRVIAQ